MSKLNINENAAIDIYNNIVSGIKDKVINIVNK